MENTEPVSAAANVTVGNTRTEEPPRAELRDFYVVFCEATISELENAILSASDTEERAFYRKLLNLRLQTEQEKIVGERLV